MNYNLALEENKNYININLSKITSNQKELFDLKYIDKLTMQFYDEFELKLYLLEKELINKDDLKKNICISYGRKNKRNIPVLYEYNKNVIDNIKKLASDVKNYFILQKSNAESIFSYSLIMGNYKHIISYFPSFEIFAGNHNFLQALQKYISNNPKQNINISDINVYMKQFASDKKSKVIYISLFEIFRRLFYNFNEETKNLDFNYKSFRDFCVFYCDYKIKRVMKNQNFKYKDNYESFLDDDIEPDFPPNSEEEAKYLEYIENLETPISSDVEERTFYRRVE